MVNPGTCAACDFNRAGNDCQRRMEWIWRGSQSLGSSAEMFAGELFGTGNGGYGTWIGWDNDGGAVQDNPRRHDYNVDQVVDAFSTVHFLLS